MSLASDDNYKEPNNDIIIVWMNPANLWVTYKLFIPPNDISI